MLRFFRCHSRIRALPLVLAMGGLWGGRLRGETIDYAANAALLETMVNAADISARTVSLGEFMAFVEAETGLPFNYPPGVMPLSAEIAIKPAGRMSLAALFSVASAQANVVFEHGGDKILARLAGVAPAATPAAAPTPALPAGRAAVAPAPRAQALAPRAPALAPVPLPTAATPAIADEVRAIVAQTTLSHDKKEKAIVAAVRAAATAALGQQPRPAAALAAAADLAEAAARGGPEFADAIARGLGFLPAIKNIPGGPAQVRAAAFHGARTSAAPSAAPEPAAPNRSVERSAPSPAAPTATAAPAGFAPSFAAAPRRMEFSLADSRPDEAPAAAAGGAPTIGGRPVPAVEIPASADGVVRMEKFSVADNVIKGSTADLRGERVKASVSIDYLSADQLLKYSAADLSDVVFRIPGVSVAGGQFAVVRGLSDRFLSTTLQGVKVPSPDPEKQAVQLDLIPATAVEAVVVAKTFEPSQWAESSGGNMDVRTRAVPDGPVLKFSFGVKMNSNAADGGPDYAIRGGTKERLGFGSRSRLETGSTDPAWQYVPTRRGSLPLGNKLALEYAREFPLGEQRLGLLVSAFNEASYKSKSGRKSPRLALRGEAPRPATATRPATTGRPSDFEKSPRVPSAQGSVYLFAESETDFVSGLTLAAGYKFSDNHEFKFSGLFVQTGNDQAQVNETELTKDPATGLLTTVGPAPRTNVDPIYSWFKTYEYFRERNLTVLQLAGRHTFRSLGGLGATWAAQRGRSSQKDHPFIESVFVSPLANLHQSYILFPGSDAPIPIFAVWGDNRETQTAGRVDFEWPVRVFPDTEVKFTFGAALDSSEREVSGLGSITTPQRFLSSANPNEIIGQAARVVGGLFRSGTAASREIRAYHAGASVPVFSWLKLVGGARFEDFSLAVSGAGRWGNFSTTTFYTNTSGGGQFGNLLGTTATNNPPFASREWYPAAGLVLEPLKGVTLRLSQSTTNGRPSFREVSPFFNKSIESGNLVVGNPALKPAEVESRDLRLEWAPSRADFLSFSVFEKKIQNPIEKILFDTSAQTSEFTESWINNPGRAELHGFEFEFRHRLGRWTDLLNAFSLSGNFTSIKAEVPEHPVVVSAAAGGFQDRTKIPQARRLFDQPEYIGNLELTWANARFGSSATFSAYAISDTLSVAGLSSFSFDLYERAHLRYDFIFNQRLSSRLKLRLAVKNLTDPVRGTIYDREATSELFVRNEYRAGREYGLSLTADF
jgi:hypothetical protein